jgi:RNase P subunit RPR2
LLRGYVNKIKKTATTIIVRSNKQCKHTFCEDCIVDYFSNKQRHLRVDPAEPMNPCPVYRREYCTIIIDNNDNDEEEN